jgi:predicted PurR-regulated permease PerM
VTAPTRLRVTTRSIVVTVALFAVTLASLSVFSASRRVIGWLVAAAVVAGLLYPAVEGLGRHMRRGFALLIVLLIVAGVLSIIAYGFVDDVRRETERLQRAAPKAAQEIESSRRFGQAAREFHLAERTQQFVDQLPSRLVGGTGSEVARAVATRFVAYLASTVLMIFLLLYGSRLATGALNQIRNPLRRARAKRVMLAAYHRAHRYIVGRVALCFFAGLFTYVACHVAEVPGPVPLALFVGAWSAVPTIGVIVGALPVVLLAAGLESGTTAIALFLLFVGYQVAERLTLQRYVDRQSIRLGPVLTLLSGMLGFELYGVGGLLVAVAITTFFACIADELAPSDADVAELEPSH